MTKHYSLQTEYGAADELFKAIMDADDGAYSRLKKSGAVLSDEVKHALTHSTGTRTKPEEGHYIAIDFEGTIQRALMDGRLDYFVSTLRAMRREVGEPLYFTNSAYWGCTDIFYDRAVFECILDCFDNRKINKKQNMIYAIDNDRFDLLEIATAHDWLKMPRKRDEMIAYAESKGKTEFVAYLLDFKNRTADLAAERERAEKRMLRKLNADPNSVTELKKIWRTKKLEDGRLEITSYKGDQTEVAVPEKIGKDTVTSIGSAAFSGAWYLSKRIAKEVCEFREKSITKITLPETITTIGEYAFYYCRSLKEVNIPNGVKVIENSAFRQTAIDVLELPGSVERLADYSLSVGNFKEVKLPQSLAEIGKSAFQMCEYLEKIEIPARVKEILQGAFWRCVKLKEVALPEGIETIKARAFWECPELETINLPASIKKIENFKRDGKPQHIFADSPKLTAAVERGSYAEKYCAKNNIAYKYKEDK